MSEELGNQQLTLCRNVFLQLEREVRQKGISKEAVETSRTTLVERQNNQWYIKPIAFLPTGVALGCPLPQLRVQKLLYRAAKLIGKWVQGNDDPTRPAFAYVPSESYHITIVNRSHYEFNEVLPLTLDEKIVIEHAVTQLNIKRVSVVTSGIFLTHTGRIFIKCLVLDDNIFNMRNLLAKTLPQLQVNIPRLVYIKLGHLLKPLNDQELLGFNAWLERLENYVIARLDFTDLYTPAGKIEL